MLHLRRQRAAIGMRSYRCCFGGIHRIPFLIAEQTVEKMTPTTNTMLTSRTMIRWLFALCLTAGALFAQSTGTIAGRVFDQATGRSLQGAVVHIKGSTVSDVTDAEGRFSLTGIPAGAAT